MKKINFENAEVLQIENINAGHFFLTGAGDAKHIINLTWPDLCRPRPQGAKCFVGHYPQESKTSV